MASAMDVKTEAKSVQFGPALEKTVREVVPNLDPLDAAEFDPVAYINNIFPDERSLTYREGEADDPSRPANARLTARLAALGRESRQISAGISRSVRKHSCQRVQTKQAVGDARQSINTLFTKIKSIKAKAEKSEKMVQEICRDIKSLDHAKTHLTATIKSLMKLHMLVQAVDMLVYMSEKKQYKDVAERLGAVDMLFLDFAEYNHIPKIGELRKVMNGEREKLQKQIMGHFHMYGPDPSSGLDDMKTMLAEGCLVIENLGSKAKDDLLMWFSRAKLGPYTALFGPGKTAGVLEQTDRRYSWLRRTFREYDDNFGDIFPRSWSVPAILSRDFCLLTKDHLRVILKATPSDRLDINALVTALTKTIGFEDELQARFGAVKDKVKSNMDPTSDSIHMEANAIKLRHKRREEEEKDREMGIQAVNMDFKRLISSVFDPYLDKYVLLERENISTLLAKIEKEEKWEFSDADSRRCLACSGQMFIYIKKSLRRCSRLATGKVLLDISAEYSQGLQKFAALLRRNLPRVQEPTACLTKSENLAACLIANTAEESKDIVPGIADAIAKVIDAKFRDQVDFSKEQEQFSALVGASLEHVVRGFCARMDKILSMMLRMPWATFEGVGDQSEYVNQINSMFSQYIPPIAELLSAGYYIFFCNKLAQLCIPRYEEHIFKCKRVNALGAQQLALDSHAIKSIFIAVPKQKEGISDRRLRSYVRTVDRLMSRNVAIVKTLASPNDCLIATFKTLMPRGAAASASEVITKILYLKGLKKADQQALVDSFNASVEEKDQVMLDTSLENKFSKFFKFGS